jgi:trans-aconitate methyltransferase
MEGQSEVIRILRENDISTDDVIDIGCGDMKMWKGQKFRSYVGIDSSKEIILSNRKSHPDYTFEIQDIGEYRIPLAAPTVTCLNVLFHIRDDDTFIKSLVNLTRYSTRDIVIVTWRINPLNEPNVRHRIILNLLAKRRFKDALRLFLSTDIHDDLVYQRYRPFENYFKIFSENGFDINKIINTGKFGAFYIFRKR